MRKLLSWLNFLIIFNFFILINMNKTNFLDLIPNCIIDPKGKFKYIQILVENNINKESKHVVRGYSRHKFHADNFEDFSSKI